MYGEVEWPERQQSVQFAGTCCKQFPISNLHWPGTIVEIIPMSRTCIPHILTHTKRNTLINPKNDPPDKLSDNPSRHTSRIFSHFHIHNVQGLHHLLSIYIIKCSTTHRHHLQRPLVLTYPTQPYPRHHCTLPRSSMGRSKTPTTRKERKDEEPAGLNCVS
jgi:hypothetical protein